MNSLRLCPRLSWSSSVIPRRNFGALQDPPAPTEKVTPLYLKRYHEPKYLELLKPQIPFYELVNVRLRGYDYVVLEEYARFVQKVAGDLKITLNNFWALPPITLRQDSYNQNSEIVASSEVVKIYERYIQVKHLTSKVCPLFVEAVQSAKPPGVTLYIAPHTQVDEDIRYIPDLQLEALEKELEELKQPISLLTPAKKTGKK